MTPAFEKLQKALKQLPGLGFRSAERVALHLMVEKPEHLSQLIEALQDASSKVHRCAVCGNLCEDETCAICQDTRREKEVICVVEQVPDLAAIERSAAYRGAYHVLHGKLSPIQDIGPEDLNLESLKQRVENDEVQEIILAISNDIEGEATCHYIQKHIIAGRPVKISRIGFGLPSGGGIVYADAVTLRSAMEGRRDYS